MMRAKPTETRTTPANVSQPGLRRPSRACVDIVASLLVDRTEPSHVEESNACSTRHRLVGMMPYRNSLTRAETPALAGDRSVQLRDPRVRARPGFARTLSRRTFSPRRRIGALLEPPT